MERTADQGRLAASDREVMTMTHFFKQDPELPPDVRALIDTIAQTMVINGKAPTKKDRTHFWKYIKTGAANTFREKGADERDIEVYSDCWANLATESLNARVAALRAAGAVRVGRA
jgi:hypothetical protein